MIKKLTLLAMAIGAVVAFAAPSVASANWTHEGVELEEGDNRIVKFTGPAEFFVGAKAVGYGMAFHAEIELTAGTTTGHVTSFTDTDCTGFGALANTTCTGTAENLKWDVTYDEANDDLIINDIKITNRYWPLNQSHATNPVATTVLEGDTRVSSTNPLTSIGTLTLSGEGTRMNGMPGTLAGALIANPEGTYGVE